jgi:hypothetical protein
MRYLCLPYENDRSLELREQPVQYRYENGNRPAVVWTHAPGTLRTALTIDLRLRDQVVRCLAAGLEDCPTLSEVLNEAETQVANRGPDDNSDYQNFLDMVESDDAIKEFLQKFFFDADVTNANRANPPA